MVSCVRLRRERGIAACAGSPGGVHRAGARERRAVGALGEVQSPDGAPAGRRRDGGVLARPRDPGPMGDLRLSGVALERAYEKELARHKARANRGECSALSWGGEREWLHGPDKPGGRYFCYFDGNDAVTSGRTGGSTSRATEKSLSPRARTVATTRVSPTGGTRGTTASARRTSVRARRTESRASRPLSP